MLKVNEYFDGKVKSIAFTASDCPATVGVMAPGEYEFGTSKKEVMTVTSGKLAVKLPDSAEWKTFRQGEAFTIAPNNRFKLQVKEESSYLCFYLG